MLMNATLTTQNNGAPEAAPSSGQAVRAHEVSPLITLIRREYWEHRSLWLGPLAVAIFMIAMTLLPRFNLNMGDFGATMPPVQAQRAMFAVAVWIFGLTLYLTMSIVVWFYATDCLYAERRDRSILFWKSMPVSDTKTVLSKVLVALVVEPLGVFVLTALTSLVVSAVLVVRAHMGNIPFAFWDTGTWVRVQMFSLLTTVIAGLWYAPILGYLMLVSAWARRNVQLWVLLPPLVAIFLEWRAFGTQHLWHVLRYRLTGPWPPAFQNTFSQLGGPASTSGGTAFSSSSILAIFGNVDLWLGLAVAALLIAGAIRIRRYRDDT
jgi:ABC-2 type transport system permease protein